MLGSVVLGSGSGFGVLRSVKVEPGTQNRHPEPSTQHQEPRVLSSTLHLRLAWFAQSRIRAEFDQQRRRFCVEQHAAEAIAEPRCRQPWRDAGFADRIDIGAFLDQQLNQRVPSAVRSPESSASDEWYDDQSNTGNWRRDGCTLGQTGSERFRTFRRPGPRRRRQGTLIRAGSSPMMTSGWRS